MNPRISICAEFLGSITARAAYRDGGARPCETRRTAARARCLVALAPLLAGSLAHAEVAEAPLEASAPMGGGRAISVGQPQMAPADARPVEDDAAAPRRWSLALAVGSLHLSRDGRTDREAFAIGELAVRYRATQHLELEIGVGGGRQRVDGEDGEQEVVRAALALRYRFSPEGPWSWFVMGGLGGAALTRQDASDREREDALQPMAMVGLGVERRFGALALHAEARALALGEREQREGDGDATAAVRGEMHPLESSSERRDGGSLTLGMSYEF